MPRKVIYRCLDVSLSRTSEGYVVCRVGEDRPFENVLEAWPNFIDTLDAAGRRRIAALAEKASAGRTVLVFCRDVSLSSVPGGYVVGVEGGTERFFADVYEAWTNYIDRLDAIGRRRINAMIKREKEKENDNRP